MAGQQESQSTSQPPIERKASGDTPFSAADDSSRPSESRPKQRTEKRRQFTSVGDLKPYLSCAMLAAVTL